MANAFVEIIEQPSSTGVRFRYKCEGRSAGCIRGLTSSVKNKTYPAIKIHGYEGKATCVVSCVAKDGPPHYPHPHNLVGKHDSEKGICYRTINTKDMTCSFPNLGIQCVKKKEIKESLAQRQQLRVDPFGTGFSYQTNKISLNVVRLCFQVFLADSSGQPSIPLAPVISDPIFDNKTISDLTITKLSHKCSPVIGGSQIILLCDQINKDDIEILFFEEIDDEVVWSSLGQFLPSHVHRKAAIFFYPPAYKNLNISKNVEVFIQLRRPSDGAIGKAESFTYMPLKYDPDGMLRKKHKFDVLKRQDWLLSFLHEVDQDPSVRRTKKAVRKKNKIDTDANLNLMACPSPQKTLPPNPDHFLEFFDLSESLPSSSHDLAPKASNLQPSSMLNSDDVLAIASDHLGPLFSEDALLNLDLSFESSAFDSHLNLNFDSNYDNPIISKPMLSSKVSTAGL